MQAFKPSLQEKSQVHLLSNFKQVSAISSMSTSTNKMRPENNSQQNLALVSISDLWGKFVALYGRAFTQQYGANVDKEGVWEAALTFVSPEKMEYGFKKLLLNNQFKVFPPNPFQFRELCEVNPGHKYLPTSKDALTEAQNYFSLCARDGYIWSHPVVKFCASK